MTNEPLPADARSRFAALLSTRDAELDLGEAALIAASAARPGIDRARTVAELNRLAAKLRDRLEPRQAPKKPGARARRMRRPKDEVVVLRALRETIFEDGGIRLATSQERRDAGLLLLDQVMERCVALPITLAVIELEVARRLRIRLEPIDVRGRLSLVSPEGLVVDLESGLIGSRPELPFIRGRRGQIEVAEPVIVGRRLVIQRLLQALQRRNIVDRSWAGALGIIELYDVLTPGHPEYHRDRGMLLGRMGRYTDAIEALTRYLDAKPRARDADSVRRVVAIFRGCRN